MPFRRHKKNHILTSGKLRGAVEKNQSAEAASQPAALRRVREAISNLPDQPTLFLNASMWMSPGATNRGNDELNWIGRITN